MKIDVVGFAAINEDRISHVFHGVKGSEIFSIEPPGGLNSDERAFLGGSVTNTLVGLVKYGLKAAIIGLLGNDSIRRIQHERLKNYGLIPYVKILEGNSSVAKIEKGGDRRITVYPGVNDKFNVNDVQSYRDLVSGCSLFHSSTFACAFNRYNSLESQIEFVKMAKELGIKRSLSFGMLYCEIFKQRKTQLIKKLLDNTDILFLNESELRDMTAESEYRNAALKMRNTHGIEVLAVTLGKEGSHVFGRGEDYFIEACKIDQSKVVNTIGPGDAFAAGFLVGHLRNKDLYTCGRFGNLNAANCIKGESGVDYAPAQLF